MNALIARALEITENEVAAMVSKLESACNYPGEDIRLMTENKQRARSKIAQLGLDPQDTTEEELYHALWNRYQNDSQALDRAIGVDSYTSAQERLNKAIDLAVHAAKFEDMWVVKKAAAKKAIIKFPPKQVAKLLGYRSVSSLVKRVDIAEIFLAANLAESATWQKNISKHLAKISESEYELRPVKIIKLSERLASLNFLTEKLAISDLRIGAVALIPTAKIEKTPVMTLVLMLLSELQELSPTGYSDNLNNLNPVLRWWSDCSHLTFGDNAVSFNVKDVALNQLHNKNYNESDVRHAGKNLWAEMLARYRHLSESALEVLSTGNNTAVKIPVKRPLSRDLAAELAMVE